MDFLLGDAGRRRPGAAAPRIPCTPPAGAAADPAGPVCLGGGDRRCLAGGAAARHAAGASRRRLAQLAAAAALALLGAGLALAQERAQLAAGEAARARLRDAAFARLLETGPADQTGVGDRASLVVDRVEAMDGYFARWIPAAALAMVGPVLVLAAVASADLGSGVVLAIAGVLYPVAMALTGIGAAQASRRQFEALGRLSGRFLDRMRGLPTLVLFNRQEAEAVALGEAAAELRAPHHEGAAGRLPLGHGAGAALGRRAGLPGLAAPGAARRRGRPDRGAVQPAAGAGLLRPAARLRRGLPGPALGRRRRRGAGAAAGGRPGTRPAAGGDAAARGRHLQRCPAVLRPGPAAGAGWPVLPGERRGDAGAGRAVGRRQVLGAADPDGLRPAGCRARLDQRPGRAWRCGRPSCGG